MLHELLVTLSGYPGDIFQPFPPEPLKATTFAVHDFPLLHPAETEGLNRLAQLGFYFKEFNDFIAIYRTPTFTSTSNLTTTTPPPSQGLYLKALAISLETRLLCYRRTIIQTEAAILSGEDNLGGMVPLSTISARFAPFQLVFPAISKLISQIRAGYQASPDEQEDRIPYSGGALIDLLQDKAASGVPIQKEWMNDLLQGCCAVMIRQIVSWVIYGQIQDPFGEFFIYSLQPNNSSSGFKSKHQTSTTGSSSHRQPMFSSASASASSKKGSTIKWQAEFALDHKLIPAMVPVSLAQNMLFIGKSIATGKQAKPKPILIPQSMSQKHLGLFIPLITLPPSPGLPKDCTTATASMTPLKTLNLNQLSHVIYQIRSDIANHLWVAAQVGERVVSALEAFRRYFLLGDGELTLALIDGLEEFKRNRLSRLGSNINSAGAVSIRDHDLGGLLIKAAQRAQSARSDPFLKLFDLRLARTFGTEQGPGAPDSGGSGGNGGSGMFDDQLIGIPIRLWYTLTWPLDFFLTTDDLAHYGDIFAFLMTARKAQVKLQLTWVHVKMMAQGVIARKKNEKKAQGPVLFKRRKPGQPPVAETEEEADNVNRDLQEAEMIKHVGAVRSEMAFVIDCLWTYLQSDVIGPTFDSLLQSISTTGQASKTKQGREATGVSKSSASPQTFDSIHTSHAEALHEIRRACLLTSQNLSQSLKNIFQSAEAFCGVVSRRASTARGEGGQEGGFQAGLGEDQDEMMWQDWTDIMMLNKAFREDSDKFFEDLSTVSRSGTLNDGPSLKRARTGLGSSLLGNGAQPFDMVRQVDQLLLRLEFSKSMQADSTSQDDDQE
ncbi:Gamma-tubulin complex component 4 [Podila humilis]|nr:Gamma-tubulin complex component 4 [Podila humilis]